MSLSPSVGARPRALAVLAALFAVASAHAQCPSVIRVPEDAASINEAVAQVCAGTTAEITVGSGTWSAFVVPPAGSTITLRGVGRHQTTILPAGPQARFSNVPRGAALRLANATLQGQGGIGDEFFVSFSHCDVIGSGANFFPEGATVSDTRFIDCNEADGAWGTLYLQDFTTVLRCEFVRCARALTAWGDGVSARHQIQDCLFRDCGVSIQVFAPTLIERCTLDDPGNVSTLGIRCGPQLPAGSVTPLLRVVDSVFSGLGQGQVGALGGAMTIGHPDSAGPTAATELVDCTFANCQAGLGGAVFLRRNESLTVSGCSFEGNAAQAGGAICQQGGGWIQALAIGSCTFEGNSGLDGGGAIAINGGIGTALINDCSFVENAGGSGGAIATANATVAVTSCGFDGNLSSYGGGIWSEYSVLTVEECAFTENEATATYWEAGGAIEVVLGTAQIERSSFIRNVASSGSGGAIAGNNVNAAYSGMPFRVSQCSFVDNEAAWFGGSVFIHWANTSGVGVFDSEFQGSMAYEGADIMAHSVANEVSLAGCAFRGQPNEAPLAVRTTSPADRGLRASGSSFCGLGSSPFTYGVFDAGGNCVVESCFDSDTNGIPDACQVVSVPGDFGTIQQAIDATPKGAFRIVSVAPGVYAGPILFHGKAVLVRGAGAGATILQGSGGARSSVVRFTGGEPITAGLEGITVRGGQTGSPFPGNPAVLVGGGVFGFNSAASIRDCIIEQNASGFGGGAYFWFSTGSIERTVLRLNTASADGGGLQAYGGALRCTDVSIVDNDANSRGGGMHLVEGVPVLTRVSVTSNGSNNIAGGISWVPQGVAASRLVLDACTVTDNVANVSEGGISCVDDSGGAKLDLRGTRVCANVPVPNVAGPYVADASSEVCDCIADVTLDGLVNGADLAGLLSAWGTDGGPTPRADCNRDGTVDGSDLGIVLGGWGTCAP